MTAVQKARRREAHKLENVPVTLATSIVVFVFVDLYLSICICVFVLVYFCICLYMCICKKTRGHMRLENVQLSLPPSQYFTRKSDPGWQMENNCQKKYFCAQKKCFSSNCCLKTEFCDSKSFFLLHNLGFTFVFYNSASC